MSRSFPHLLRLSGEGRALEAAHMIGLDWSVVNFVALCVFVYFEFDVLFERVENNEESLPDKGSPLKAPLALKSRLLAEW